MGSLSDPPDPYFTAAEEDVESSVLPPVASPGSASDVGLVDYKVDLNCYCQSPKHLDKENLSPIEEDVFDMSTFSKLGTTWKRSKKDNGVNLRKSLAWNPAFFTEEGVLNPLELCVLGGSSLRSKEKVLSVVNEHMSPLLGGLHDRTPVNTVDRQKFYGKTDALSVSKNNIQFKEENLHSKLNASIWEEQQEISVTRERKEESSPKSNSSSKLNVTKGFPRRSQIDPFDTNPDMNNVSAEMKVSSKDQTFLGLGNGADLDLSLGLRAPDGDHEDKSKTTKRGEGYTKSVRVASSTDLCELRV